MEKGEKIVDQCQEEEEKMRERIKHCAKRERAGEPQEYVFEEQRSSKRLELAQISVYRGFPGGLVGKKFLFAMQKTQIQSHSRILAWRIPWTEKPGGLQFLESQELT